MARTRERTKGRRGSGTFSMLPHAHFESRGYAALSARAVKALIDLLGQYRGHNNGDLCAAWKEMSKRGWTSKEQLDKAIKELIERGWIILTRQGGLHCTSLYAVTFWGIDPCGGKLDVPHNPVPRNLWKSIDRGTAITFPKARNRVRKKTSPRDTGHSDPQHGAIRVLGFANYPAARGNRPTLGGFGAPLHGDLLRLYQAGHGFKQAA